MFVEWQRRIKSSGALSQDWKISSREFIQNISSGTAPAGAKYQELTDSLPHVSTTAQIQSVLGSGVEIVPVAPTNALIPFQADADGRITAFSGTTEEEDTATADTKKTTLPISGTATDNPAPKQSWVAKMLEDANLFLGFSSNYKGIGLGGLVIFVFWGVVNLIALIVFFVARRKRKTNPKFWKGAKATLIITVTWFALVIVRIRVANKGALKM